MIILYKNLIVKKLSSSKKEKKIEKIELKVIELEIINPFYGKSSRLTWRGAIK